MRQQSPDAIKTSVRAHYGEIIRASAGTCCGGGARGQQLYGDTAIAELPGPVAAPSFGCGNPFLTADLKPGEHVLDLGSGAGLDVLLAARRVGETGRVYGLDMTDDMLEIAQQNARRVGAGNVVFLRGDIESIPLPGASVDVIISNCVVNLAPDKRATFAEAHRVLRPGGRLAISDIVVDGDLTGFPMGEPELRAALSWSGCIAGALTTTELRQILAATGFRAVGIDVISRYSRERLASRLPAEVAAMPASVVDQLIGRFTSSLISAVKA